LREAILARSDCSIAELSKRDDGSWVKVGGIVTEFRKMRTRNGGQMAFATLSDIEAEVELIIFRAGESEKLAAIEPDAVIMVKGRVDQTEKGTKIVAQEAVVYNPSEKEIAEAKEKHRRKMEPLTVRIDTAILTPDLLEEIKAILQHHKGETEVHLLLVSSEGQRRLKLGPDYRVRRSAGLLSELDDLLGPGEARAA
jgi:DNA polymerase-3 subunit alpha